MTDTSLLADSRLPKRGPLVHSADLADAVSRLRRAMRRAARAADPGSGLSVAQLELLSCMAENPGSRPGQLARLLRLAPSSVATLANSLRQADLVTRTGGAGDRRTASLDLTPAGEAAVLRWKTLNERLLSLAQAALPPASRSALEDALPTLAELAGAVDALADLAGTGDALADPDQASAALAGLPGSGDSLAGLDGTARR
jgi:DNA-binding MarR family transcriptional regulator